MLKILDLVLIGKWYDLITDGIKREEYRALTAYWCNRFFLDSNYKPLGQKKWNSILSGCVLEAAFETAVEGSRVDKTLTIPTHVRFRRGYTSISKTYKIESITIGLGKSEWGAGVDPTFIIKFN